MDWRVPTALAVIAWVVKCTSLPQGASEDQLSDKYDFIIVGAGATGSVLANRLSEAPEWTVLLLEAGEQPTALTDIPAITPAFQFTNYSWGYFTEKQDNFCLGLEDERMNWAKGKALGGSSVINYMIHTRGNRLDYDRWAEMGNPGWSYKDVLPYFLKSEDASLRIQDPQYHRQGGYLSVQDVPYRTQAAAAFVAAAQEAGLPYVDYNGKEQMGVSWVQATTRRGKRCSAEKAFLRTARERPNLTILPKARVIKVLIDATTKRAQGIRYIRNNRYHEARASKDVILSAGSFGSPQLLMLSGVGPKHHLQELGIKVLQDLPVGQKLYDHLVFPGLTFIANQSITLQETDFENPAAFLELLLSGTGPLTSLGTEALAFVKTKASQEEVPYPDAEILFAGVGMHTDKGLGYRRVFRIKQEVYDAVWKPIEDRYAFNILPMLVHPESHGNLRLKSTNPFHWPKFYGNYLTDPDGRDLKTLVASIRETQRIISMPAFQKYGVKIHDIPVPGCEDLIFDSDGYWECAIRHVAGSPFHQTTACKMGPESDPEAVVDHRLRVYGIGNLRVADTSVIPIPLTGHTNVPAYMVGEKTADIVKSDWMSGEDPRDVYANETS